MGVVHGASADADRAGGPSDLSRQAVSAKGAHPLRKTRAQLESRVAELEAALTAVRDLVMRVPTDIIEKALDDAYDIASDAVGDPL